MSQLDLPAEVYPGARGCATGMFRAAACRVGGAARSRTAEARLVERTRIVLACLEGKRNDAVGRELGVRPNTVGLWCKRFAARGMAGLQDRARPGKAAKYGPELRLRILRELELPPPKGVA